jgi:alcohol dehydrogenase, propanol-preferring
LRGETFTGVPDYPRAALLSKRITHSDHLQREQARLLFYLGTQPHSLYGGLIQWQIGRAQKSLRRPPRFPVDLRSISAMHAMILEKPGTALRETEVAAPSPSTGQVKVRVRACAVCRTDLHVVDGELPHPKLPLIPGHEIVGEIVERGAQAEHRPVGTRVGIPWLGWTCGHCQYCRTSRENLCDQARFTGYTIDGGYAEYAVADAAFCFPLPEFYTDVEAAPLLCAGLIGYRSLVMAGPVKDSTRLGIYGFGAAAHIIAQVAIHQGREIYAFTKPGKTSDQDFARSLGAVWAGGSDELPPYQLDAAIIFAPAGPLVVAALRAVRKGGRVVCGGIHMSDIPSFPYSLLWEERSIRSVANLTRADARSFLGLAPTVPVRTETETFWMSNANEALERLRKGRLRGAAVLVPNW